MNKKASLDALKKIRSTLRARRIAKKDEPTKDPDCDQPQDTPADIPPKKVK